MPALYRIFGFLRFIILFVYIHEKRETCRLQFGTRGFLDYLFKPNIREQGSRHCVSIRALSLVKES